MTSFLFVNFFLFFRYLLYNFRKKVTWKDNYGGEKRLDVFLDRISIKPRITTLIMDDSGRVIAVVLPSPPRV